MKTRYRLIRRGVRGGAFYCVDNNTGKRTSLRTGSEDEARQIVEAKNQAERQPVLNLQIAKAYLAGTDNGITTRTWQHAIEALTGTKQGANRERWLRVVRDRALAPLLPRVIIETRAEVLLRVLQTRTVSTNVYLRSVRVGDRSTEFHQRCVGLGIKGVSLHSYRYAWAERAKTCGYPERFAQLALGHNSKAVHRAYAKNAQVTLPPVGRIRARV